MSEPTTSGEGRRRRVLLFLLVGAALIFGLFRGGTDVEPPEATVSGEYGAQQPGSFVKTASRQADVSTDAIGDGQYGHWKVGDTHVHLAGDSGVLFNNRCRPNDERGLDDVMSSLDACAERLVASTYELAEHNGLDWAILTEHGPWLGSPQLTQCGESVLDTVVSFIPGSVANSVSCVRHATTFYSYDQSVQAWDAIRRQLGAASAGGPDLLLGQEIGTAAGISALCSRAAHELPFAARYGPGHVGVYTMGGGLPLENSIFDCDEAEYLEWLEDEGLIGAINHPDNGDGGSDWHCWNAGDKHRAGLECDRGANEFMTSVNPITWGTVPVDHNPVVGLAMVTDTKAPSDSTISNMLDLLRAGRMVGFVGGSDSHAITRERDFKQSDANDGKIGLAARTYAWTPGPMAPTEVDALDHPVRVALANRATVASLGPLLAPEVEGRIPGETAPLRRDGTARLVVSWPTSVTWPHIQVGSGGFEVTNGEFVPRLNERSHRPAAIEVYVVPVRANCATGGCDIEPLRLAIPSDGSPPASSSALVGASLVSTGTDLDAGVVSLDLELPHSPVNRWAVVVRGDYGSGIALTDKRHYPVEAWASPIWIDGSSTRHRTSSAASGFEPPIDAAESDAPSSQEPRAFTSAEGAASYVPSRLRVVDQSGEPVTNASMQMYMVDGNELIPLPPQSMAIDPANHYQALIVDDAGNLDIGLAPGAYVAVASGPMCESSSGGIPFTAGEPLQEPIVLSCPDPDLLPVSIDPVSLDGAETITVDLACERPDGSQFAVTETVATNERTDLAYVPLGTICTANQALGDAAPGTRFLSDEVQTEPVSLRGVEFVSYTTSDIQPASFAIDTRPYDPNDVGDEVTLSLWCPGYDTFIDIDIELGERFIVEGMVDGDTCAVRYVGDRLAFPQADVHLVDVVGTVLAEGHEGHDHDHDAIFSVVELRFGSEPVGVLPPIPNTKLPPVVFDPPPPPPPQPPPPPPPTRTPPPTPQPPVPRCPEPSTLDGERCAERVQAISVSGPGAPFCPEGWTLTSDESRCTATWRDERAPDETRRCPPPGTYSRGACVQWIEFVDPVKTGCEDGSELVDGRCVWQETRPPRCGEEYHESDAECLVGLTCDPGGTLIDRVCVWEMSVPPFVTCPEGSTPEGLRCRLRELRIEPVQEIVEYRCPEAYVLEGDVCVNSGTETIPAQRGSVVELVCPDHSTYVGRDDAGLVCMVFRQPNGG